MKRLLLLVLLVVAGEADYLLQFKMGNETSTFYYKDEKHQKMQTTSDICKGGEVYRTPKGVYAVGYNDGELTMIDLLQARSFLKSMGMEASSKYDPLAGFDVKETSQTKTVAGLKARKWILTDKQSKKTDIIYVSDDGRLGKISKALYSLFTTAVPQAQDSFLLKNRYVIVEGEGYKLESFKKVSKPYSFYALPTKESKVLAMCKKEAQKENTQDYEATNQSSKNGNYGDEVDMEKIKEATKLLEGLF